MSGAFRLPRGGRIDRTQRLRFQFDGGIYEGFAGDTLTSALIANGVHLVGRSFKYHRPRGIVSAGSDEPNALVGVARDEARYTPNLQATQIELYEGLVAESQNRWPSLRFDVSAVRDALAPLFPAGFYYKTFMWPAAAWKRLYEPLIRAAAGLGRAPRMPDPDCYTQRYAHCDVLITGAGPAGLTAAMAAAQSGARIILCDEQAEFGGSLLAETEATIDDVPTSAWLANVIAALADCKNVTLLPRTTAFGYYPHNLVGLAERVTDHLAHPDPNLPRERLWQVRAKEVVLATGAIERPLVFPENDRPGIMLAQAARTYTNRYGAIPGTRAVVFTTNDAAYRAALDLAQSGIEIAAIADLRQQADGALPTAARAAGLNVFMGTSVVGTAGRLRISAAHLAKLDRLGSVGASKSVPCDLLLMSGGFTPTVHLFSQSRGKLLFDDTLQAYVPGRSVERVRSAGACRGAFSLSAALDDGHAQGRAAAEAAGCSRMPARCFSVSATDASADGFNGVVPHGRKTRRIKAFVDFQNDVTTKDLELATQEGFQSIEHVKRYTTTGMATDQGKTSNINALGVVSAALRIPIPQIGFTTFRPPYTPVTFGTLAGMSRGPLFDPVRTTPIHSWAEANGAVFEDGGAWKRAHYFPRPSETRHAAVARECKAVRESVGIFDASTLGKIEVVGADAADFMDRMYTDSWTKLEPGRLRYGLMLREDGFLMDDGVVGRLGSDRFHVTTTTGGASRVLHMMEDYLQTEWPHLDVWLTSTTEQWAVIAVQGPRSREVLDPLVDDIDISAAAMPHMTVKEGHICGVPTRLFRVSFTGELGFEVNVPAGHGCAVWEAIVAAGKPYGIMPYGTETMHVLRAEKGYIIVGQEADGTATPDDVGLGWTIGKAKRDFVGKRALARPAMTDPRRKQLVGLLTERHEIVLEEGAQIVADPKQRVQMATIGHVTSSYWSAVLGRSIALAMVCSGRRLIGERLFVPMPDRTFAVKVVDPQFYDPKGERLHA
jgi:sarcosine oxidase subunit alpha